ncbi:ATP-binding protein [Marinomonas posidonica]|uniref:Sensory/regulatory protein RpfC n=1 Tax=Marinomonas posidonica (strain CECT 7376 / NCIMB 14433 / IVIA-Po-181) TaxID=491952 RepID=F6CYM5_MARPP|nr:ATP-binding protein [Marinomonas posidonica]AEF55707.1 integral membrane sensor hybrid histidine kinase [Marinomonas posidonica IVIA-Po-181]
MKSRYTLGDKQVSEISLKDLARRSRYGGLFYLLAFWAAVFSSATAREHLAVISAFSVCFILLQAARFYLYYQVFASKTLQIPAYFSRYAFVYNASAIVWVSGSAWLFYVNPLIDISVTVNVMSAAGISIGGVTILALSHKMLRNYCLLIGLPFAFAAAAFLEGPGNWIVMGLIIGYGFFIYLTGKQLNVSYWQALNDNLKLSEQAEELSAAKEAAEVAGQAKADFLAAMTHEIRTPLNGVLGMAQLLSMGDLSDQQRQQVSVINNAGSTLMHIINNILDYSKINAQQLSLEKIPFSPQDVVNDVVQLLSTQSEKKGIQLYCHFNNVPESVLGDPHRLHQILYNLVGNAFKFTHEGEIAIQVSGEKTREEANEYIVSFAVKDTGIGIAPEDQQRIFDQFYQVNQFNPNIRGTGLGLSITQRIVALLGGQISLQSEVGRGTVFTVALPFERTESDRVERIDHLSQTSENSPETTQSLRILLVEDNKVNQIVCEQFLLKLGCRVDLAENGLIAKERFRQAQVYDVIFMDCNMPEMDGFLATRAIRQIEADQQLAETPIVALTAHVEEDIKRKCLQSGMNAFLSKPFLFEDLESIINSICMGRRD